MVLVMMGVTVASSSVAMGVAGCWVPPHPVMSIVRMRVEGRMNRMIFFMKVLFL